MGQDDQPTPPRGEDASPGPGSAARSPGSGGGKRALPHGIGYDTTRGRPAGFFITPDTAPPGLSVPRPRWVTPVFLALFAACAAGLDRWIPRLTHVYGRMLLAMANVPEGTFGKQTSVAVRPLVLLLALLFAVLAAGTVWRRLRLFLTTVVAFAALALATDLALTRLALFGGPGPFGALGNTIAGLDGIAALAIGVFTSAALPPGVVVRAERKRPHRDIALLCVVVAAAVVAVLLVKRHWGELLVLLSKAPLLGGIASALVVFFGLFPGMLYALNITRRCTNRGKHAMLFPVGILVPARNEEGLIGDCIRAIDEAVADYPEQCTVYVVENGSSDRTLEEARAAIREARHVRGVLLQCESRGKAYALNYGLRHVTEEIVLRIDADTLVTQSVLFGLIRHFGDPSVGGASGMPLPRVQESWICRMRALEVYYQVGFKRAGYNAVDAIGVLPGALVAYRRDLLVKLNGFAEGVNGEDADMTVRVGRLGYRIVSDASVRAYTEMPSTFAYLREQRMRWARGTYHMLARNKSGIVMMQGLRCVWMLPWAGFIMFRRLMMLPFAAAGLFLVLLNHSSVPLQEISAGGALFLGVQLIQMIACMVLLGDTRLIASIPSYLIFRLIVSFYALETLLTLAFTRTPGRPSRSRKPLARTPRSKTARLIQGLSPKRLGDAT
jgi:cellulose synthase/poly-beta-1,6-N-acetylglucosamine synthase-like glycosyltransferase